MAHSCDNSGNRVPVHPHCVDPVAASGQTLTTAGTPAAQTVTGLTGGKMYAITPIGLSILASITGVVSTVANIEFVFPANVTSIFRIPLGKTTLYYLGDTGSKSAYLREIA